MVLPTPRLRGCFGTLCAGNKRGALREGTLAVVYYSPFKNSTKSQENNSSKLRYQTKRHKKLKSYIKIQKLKVYFFANQMISHKHGSTLPKIKHKIKDKIK